MNESEKECAQALINAVALQRNQALDAAAGLMAEVQMLKSRLAERERKPEDKPEDKKDAIN